MKLINQPGPKPNRKISAVIIAGIIIGAINGFLTAIFPGGSFTHVIEPLSPYIMGFVMALSGYMTRERHD